jgi:hypothetical protein
VGRLEVEEGESLFRHAALLVRPTTLRSELPPLRPRESDIENMTPVPAGTLAVHWKLLGPTGGVSRKEVPPGIVPCQYAI